MPPSRLEELRLPPLLAASGSSEDPKGTAYHLTIDANSAKHPTTTGISAHDRAFVSRLVASGAAAAEFTRPGHLVPLRYTPGGTRVRFGHTEAAVGEFSWSGGTEAEIECRKVEEGPAEMFGAGLRRSFYTDPVIGGRLAPVCAALGTAGWRSREVTRTEPG